MSVETAKAFLTKFTAEPTVRTQLYIMSPKTIEDFIHYAHSKTGYSFTKEDLSTALKGYNLHSTNEIKQRYSL